MADHWVGFVDHATKQYVKGFVDETVRRYLWLAMMERRGNLRMGVDASYESEYRVKWKQGTPESFEYGSTATFEPQLRLKTASMTWRGVKHTDTMHLDEYTKLANSAHNLVNRYNRIVPELFGEVRKYFSDEMYTDGGSDTSKMEGLETVLADDGNTVVADLIANPDDSYHGIDTDLAQGGTWTANLGTPPNATHAYDWPEGSGDSQWDFWSPLLINTTSTSWDGTNNTWEDNCIRALSRMGLWMMTNADVGQGSLLTLLTPKSFAELRESMRAAHYSLVPMPEATELGFPNTLQFEGQTITSQYGVPSGINGYSIDMDEAELLFVTPNMVESKGPTYDDKDMAYLFTAYSMGNFKWRPKRLAKLDDYADS